MKKKIALLLSCITILSSSLNVFGATGLIINNNTYVPVRGVFEELGFSVSYDNETATAIISDSKFTIKIPKDKNYFLVNEDSIKPDTPQKIVNSSLLLPLRAIGDSIGAATSWNSRTRIAHISYNGKDSYVSVKSSQTSTSKNNNSNNYSNASDDALAKVLFNSNSNSNRLRRNIRSLSEGGLIGFGF